MRRLFLLGFILVLLLGGVEAQELEYKVYLPLVVSTDPTCYIYYWTRVQCGYTEACLLRWMAYTDPPHCPAIHSFIVKALYMPAPPFEGDVNEWPLPDCCVEGLDHPGCCIVRCIGDYFGMCQEPLDARYAYSFKVWARILGYENVALGDWTYWDVPAAQSYPCYDCYSPWGQEEPDYTIRRTSRSVG